MIPISTDAPIYHYPIATVLTMVLNVMCFIAFCTSTEPSAVTLVSPQGNEFRTEEELTTELTRFRGDEEASKQFLETLTVRRTGGGWREQLSVQFGTFKPWQWLTHNYMHLGIGHLIGNLIFLWAFGLIVEGKVGAWIFLLLYNAIGTMHGVLLQISSIAIGWHGSALGASAAIFGLMALCVAWAPANEFTLLLRFSTFDVSILIYGFLFVVKESVFWGLQGFAMSSELLHIMGFFVGLPIGLVMVHHGWVDCEGWDLFSYLQGKTGSDSTIGRKPDRTHQKPMVAKQSAEARKPAIAPEPDALEVKLHRQVEQAIDQGDFDLAIKLQARFESANAQLGWKQADLYRVIQGLLKAKAFDQAMPLMETHIEKFDEHRFTIQITLIKIWLREQRPRKALRYMQGLNAAFLSPEQLQQLKQLASIAKQQIASGVMEVL
jgi:membrane associated rhomboid family serine protease